jgi:hypothetical protein
MILVILGIFLLLDIFIGVKYKESDTVKVTVFIAAAFLAIGIVYNLN